VSVPKKRNKKFYGTLFLMDDHNTKEGLEVKHFSKMQKIFRWCDIL
jgi:hypothetical protein